MQNASLEVNVTGVWLMRVQAVWVDGARTAFMAYGTDGQFEAVPASDVGSVSDSMGSSSADGGSIESEEGSLVQSAHFRRTAMMSVSTALRPRGPWRTLSSSDGSSDLTVDGLSLFGDDNSVLSFSVPSLNKTGYLPLVIQYYPDANYSAAPMQNFTGVDWLYYSVVECDTGFIVDHTCEPCPTGGYCPGGGRVWPIPGYWSFNETSAPIECALPHVCPGAVSAPTLEADGSRLTSVCSEGYEGDLCKDCDYGYYTDGQLCLSCGLQSSDKLELGFLLIAAGSLFLAMAVAVAFSPAAKLSTYVAAVIMIQHASVVGKLGGQSLPSSLQWLTQVFNVLAILNFDITFIKPGCVTAALSFITVYWATCALIAVVSLMFVAASMVRAYLSMRQERQQICSEPQSTPLSDSSQVGNGSETPRSLDNAVSSETRDRLLHIPWRWRFKARVVHSHLILGSMMYLRLATMTLEAVNCTSVMQADGSTAYVLKIDLTTECYAGPHLYSAMFLWPMLFGYCVGFPLLCFWVLYRSFHGAAKRRLQMLDLSRPGSAAASAANSARSSPLASPRASKTAKFVFNPSAQIESPRSCTTPRSRLGAAAADVELAVTANQSMEHAITMPAVTSSGMQTPVSATAASSPAATPRMMQMGGRWTGASPLLAHSGRVGSAEDSSRPSSALSPSSIDATFSRTLASARKPLRIIPQSPQSSAGAMLAEWPEAAGAQYEGQDEQRPQSAAAATADSKARRQEEKAERKRQTKLAKAALRELSKDMRRQEMLGYLYRQLKGELYFFRLLLFATSFGFAAVAVLPTDATLRLFLTGIFFLLDLLSTSCLLPFERWWKNATQAAVSVVGVLQIIIMLALIELGLQSSSGSSVDLGHSKAAQTEASSPDPSLVGFQSPAGQYEMWIGIMCCFDLAIITYVHRVSVLTVLRAAAALFGQLIAWGARQISRLTTGHSAEPVIELQDNVARRESTLPPPAPRKVKRRRKKNKQHNTTDQPTADDKPTAQQPEQPQADTAAAEPQQPQEPQRPQAEQNEELPPGANVSAQDDDDEWEEVEEDETDEERLAREAEEAAEREKERLRRKSEEREAAAAAAALAEAERLRLEAERVAALTPPDSPTTPNSYVIFAGKKNVAAASKPALWEAKTPRTPRTQRPAFTFRYDGPDTARAVQDQQQQQVVSPRVAASRTLGGAALGGTVAMSGGGTLSGTSGGGLSIISPLTPRTPRTPRSKIQPLVTQQPSESDNSASPTSPNSPNSPRSPASQYRPSATQPLTPRGTSSLSPYGVRTPRGGPQSQQTPPALHGSSGLIPSSRRNMRSTLPAQRSGAPAKPLLQQAMEAQQQLRMREEKARDTANSSSSDSTGAAAVARSAATTAFSATMPTLPLSQQPPLAEKTEAATQSQQPAGDANSAIAGSTLDAASATPPARPRLLSVLVDDGGDDSGVISTTAVVTAPSAAASALPSSEHSSAAAVGASSGSASPALTPRYVLASPRRPQPTAIPSPGGSPSGKPRGDSLTFVW